MSRNTHDACISTLKTAGVLSYEISKRYSENMRKLSQQKYDLKLTWTFVAVMGR